ncbi:L-histidine N(alpha)-methyltransferase [Ekhidna sp.]|uniref:L-histidine N(alpha)-methyltransferase n=1 Tax=Ekhidna sp. TaxID=2608089 RepID=UPI003C7DEEE7
MTKELTTLTPLAEDVFEGLQAENKYLSSKYFYDAKGDELFQQIMHLDEYYLTRKELEIFQTHKQAILEAINGTEPFRIIELGAGDGLKTKVLLKHFIDAGVDFTYTPVDISGNVLEILEGNLKAEIPGLKIEPYEGDYFDALAEIAESPEKDIVFFLGSNVGNFTESEAVSFLSKLQKFLKKGDLLFMGVDLKKDPAIILNAYNDRQGVTRAFNLNLLDRINAELDGNFDTDQFLHYPYYNPHTGECRSYLISKIDQTVTIMDEEIHFNAWEAIFMEVSKKYDKNQLAELAEKSGFIQLHSFNDERFWFADLLWQKDE